MALQIIVERLVATVERLDFVVFFETTDENRHSASHCPDEGFRRMGGFSRCEIGKALQFARRPGNFHAREHDLWRDAFEPRQHQFLARARFSFTKMRWPRFLSHTAQRNNARASERKSELLVSCNSCFKPRTMRSSAGAKSA